MIESSKALNPTGLTGNRFDKSASRSPRSFHSVWRDTGASTPGHQARPYGTLHRRAVWDDGPNAVTTMIYRDPPSVMLRRADVITLFDPEDPGWSQVVISFDGELERHAPDFVVIDIPVDSANECQLLLWRERIKLARR